MEFISLELQGFKSFMGQAKFNFQPGITAIVGPNGCGKSNIMDALRWALGEQSAKSLRGERMEDVIFNGTDQHKPLGMAEVSLKVRSNGSLPTDYEEVSITRRLFRSGESEYYLNKTPCRLKDISELFLDTGVGYKAYSLVEQGRVDFLLSSKPVERRMLIEEAAGIMKYKQRKKEALNKLELTQQNLLRISDIAAEVKRQLDKLDKQARAAQRYKRLLQQERELSLKLTASEYIRFQQSWQGVEGQRRELQQQEAARAAQTAGAEAKLEELRLALMQQQEELSALQHKVYEQELHARRSEDRINHLKETIASLMEQQKLAQTEAEQMTLEQQRLGEELERQRLALETYEQEHQTKLAQLGRQEELLREQEIGDMQQQQQLEQEKAGMIELAARGAQLNNTLHSLGARREEIIKKQDRLRSEEQQTETELEGIQQAIQAKEAELQATERRFSQLQKQTQALTAELEHESRLLKQEEQQLARLREELGLKSSQLQSLRELNHNLEGFEAGVRTLMQAKELPEAGLSGIHQVVGRLIKTESRYEAGIEAALSHRLGYIVVDDFSGASRAIEYLKQQGKGRVSLILKDRAARRESASQEIPQLPGVIGRALELVNCPPDYTSLLEYLLGDVLLVEDLGVAGELFFQGVGNWTIATLSGEVLEAEGIVSGGGTGGSGMGILARNRRIEELQTEVADLDRQHQELAGRVEKRLRHISRLSKTQDEEQGRLRNTELELVEQRRSLEHQQRELERIQQQLATIRLEQEQLGLEQGEVEAETADQQQQLSRLREEEQHRQSVIEQLKQQLSRSAERLRGLRQEVTQQRVDLASLEEKKKGTALDISRMTSAISNLERRLNDRYLQLEKNGLRRQQLEAEQARTQTSLAELAAQHEQLKQSCNQKNEAYQEQAAELSRTEQQYKQQKRELEGLQQRLGQIELEATKAQLRLNQLAEQIASQFELPLQQALEKISQAEGSPQEWSDQLSRVRKRLEAMGEVNLMAIEEYRLLQERHQFLTTQQEDLNQAIDSLHKVIARINTTTKERFKQTFDAVNEQFGRVYERLFEGGKAELRLEEGKSLLEAGVEILVQPPGKKLQNLSLLSGGEKALTAIAFLFAIYLIKPSPLCFLDEVDAALDDVNVGRLLKLLREFTSRSQFVVITHNKRTMEVADLLYGITMETPGVSKIVSVKFNDNGNQPQA
jgi:chromosome segregation protein